MPRSIRDQAMEWHDRLRHDPSPETRRAYQRWREECSEHGAEFDQQQRLVDQVARLGLSPSAPAMSAPRRRWAAIGGGAALAAALAAGVFFNVPAARSPVPDLQDTPGQAAFGPTTPVRLEDGTIVLLAAYTKVEPLFDRTLRRVRLSGAGARFLVASDRQRRPLVIEAGGVRVTTESGMVDVDLSAKGARVTAIDGTVLVSTPEVPAATGVTVRAGQLLLADTQTVVPAAADTRLRVTLIEADELMLSDLLRIANDLGSPRIALGDPSLGARRVVGRFDIQDHRALARKLGLALDLEVAAIGDTIMLTKRRK